MPTTSLNIAILRHRKAFLCTYFKTTRSVQKYLNGFSLHLLSVFVVCCLHLFVVCLMSAFVVSVCCLLSVFVHLMSAFVVSCLFLCVFVVCLLSAFCCLLLSVFVIVCCLCLHVQIPSNCSTQTSLPISNLPLHTSFYFGEYFSTTT